jgi:hypothetical protein
VGLRRGHGNPAEVRESEQISAPRRSTPARARRPGRSAVASLAPVDAFRAQFPVVERIAHPNAGTDGRSPAWRRRRRPRSRAGARAGRTQHFERRRASPPTCAATRACLAASSRSRADDLDDEGPARCWAAGLGPGDEIVTSDSEHPGPLGPPLVAAGGRPSRRSRSRNSPTPCRRPRRSSPART